MPTIKTVLAVLNAIAWGTALVMFVVSYGGCGAYHDVSTVSPGVGGGRDAITINMPFASGYSSQCVQGVGESYSHAYISTQFDLDFDTPNVSDDLLYAPIGGTAYVHESTDGFGTHINIDLGDGTYILLAHLSAVLIEHGEEVASGQILGFEGATGAATGDHVHIGRHEGDAWVNASLGTSIDGLSIRAYDRSNTVVRTIPVADFVCGLYDGHIYDSQLSTSKWHPNGALVKTPSDSNVYLIEGGKAREILDEEVFWSYNFSFDDLVIVDERELSCFDTGTMLETATEIRALYDDGQVWLLVGAGDDENRYAQRVRTSTWQATLKSWGITASTYDDLSGDSNMLEHYPVVNSFTPFRDGTIVTEAGESDVYFVADGIAMPILDWETYLLMDLYDRELMQVDDGSIRSVMSRVGDCASGSYCLSSADIMTCGGPTVEGTYSADGGIQDDEEGEGDTSEDEGDTGGTQDDEQEEPVIPDDLAEGLTWIYVDGAALGLRIGETFSNSVDGADVAVTGVGVSGGWSYDMSYLVEYDTDTDIGWYAFDEGWYRINMRTQSEWAMFWQDCLSSSTSSELCHENQDMSHALCFQVQAGELSPLSHTDCRSME